MKKATTCVHAGSNSHNPAHGMNTPIYTSSAFGYLDTIENIYPRYYNTPNQEVVVQKLCALEQGEAGLLLGSGMAAVSTTMLAFLETAAHGSLQRDLYGGTCHTMTIELKRVGISHTLADEPTLDTLAAPLRTTTLL